MIFMKFRKSIIHPIIIIFLSLLVGIIGLITYNVYQNLIMMQEKVNSERINGISNTIVNIFKLEFEISKRIENRLTTILQSQYRQGFKNEDISNILHIHEYISPNLDLVILLDDKLNLLYIKDKHSIIKSLNFNHLLLEPTVDSKYSMKLISNNLMIFGQKLVKLGNTNLILVTAFNSSSNHSNFNLDSTVHFKISLSNDDVVLQYPKIINHDIDNFIHDLHGSKTVTIENEPIKMQVGYQASIFDIFGINNILFTIAIIILILFVYGFVFYHLYNVIILPLRNLKSTLFVKIKELTDNDTVCDLKFRDNTNEIQYLLKCFDFFIIHINKCVSDVVKHRNKLTKLINSINVGIVEIDSNTFTITDVNNCALESLGLIREECIGNKCYDFLCESDKCITDGIVNIQCVGKNSESFPYTFECMMQNNKTHQYTPVLKSIVNIVSDDATLILISFINITDLKNKEDELKRALGRADRATTGKTILLGNVSHDIGNILTALKGNAEILQRDNLTDSQKSLVNVIIDSSISIANAVELMRERTLLETGQSKLKLQSINLIDIIVRLYRSSLIKCQDKNIDFFQEGLVSDTEIGKPLYVNIDSNKFSAIITNLLDNAIKFTKIGYVKSSIIILSENDKLVNLKISISDTGIGIPKDALESIFNIYEQANENIQALYGGTGVGLSICQHYAKMMGATIDVESNLDIGSTFSFSLYLDKSKPDELLISQNSIVDRNTDKLKILVAEDSNAIQMVINDKLIQLNCISTVVSNGRDAVNLIRNSYFDMLFLDIRMPIMSGLEAIEIIRNEKFQLPIIALTANCSEMDIEKYMEVGFDGFIPKPVSDDNLNNIIMKFKNRQLINIDYINRNFKTSEFYRQILESTKDEFKLNIEMLTLFENDSNFSNLQHYGKAAHAIKSIASQIGMESVRHISHILEFKFNGGINFQDVPFVTESISLLQLQFQKSLEYYDDYIKS